jgi:tRNA-uridine 2-sulfurtransferase
VRLVGKWQELFTMNELDRLQPGERVVCAMSGGVDSSVSAALLKQQGFEVIGLFMRSGVSGAQTTGEKQGCCSVEDAMDARRISDSLGMPFYALNMEEQFQEVMDYFVEAYEIGETPNPCVQCNKLLKFGHLLDFAQSVGARCVATGHYAQVHDHEGRLTLFRPKDKDKDQSYVLFVLSQHQLAHTIFPLGSLTKPEVRQLADDFGFSRVAGKKDSVEICFVPDNYRNWLEGRLKNVIPGNFVNRHGEIMGQHEGIHRFTIGQRRRLGMSFGKPVYVVAIEPETGEVVLGDWDELLESDLVASKAQWLSLPKLEEGEEKRCFAQIRYNHDAKAATMIGISEDSFAVRFDEPERAVTPGQAVVCYDENDEYVYAGAWINRARLDV